MQKFIIANANIKFLDNLDISEDDAISYVSTLITIISSENSKIKNFNSRKRKKYSLSKNIKKI